MFESSVRKLAAVCVSLVLASLVGCDIPAQPRPLGPYHSPRIEYPTVNLPTAMRQSNWIGSKGEGSCVHAAIISLFRWQGRINLANYWRRTYGSGEWVEDMAAKLERENVRFAYVTNGDVRFLEWALSTRRGCAITVQGGTHMVALVHLDAVRAGVLDNNSVSKIKWLDRATLIAEWKASSGWALAPVYNPAAPLPR